MLARQHGACAICKRISSKRLCVDHCHATDKVRGLLCWGCNIGLGNFADDPSRLREAAAYLEAARGLPSPIAHAENLAPRCPLSPALGARDAGQAQGPPAGAVPLSPAPGARDKGQAKPAAPEAVPLSPTLRARDEGQAKRTAPGAVPLSPAPARDAGQTIASHSGPDLNGATSLPPAQSASPGALRHPEADFFGDIAHRPSGHPIGSIGCPTPAQAPPPVPETSILRGAESPPPVPVNSPCCVWSAASAMRRDHHSPSG
jgi:hypothetical protein